MQAREGRQEERRSTSDRRAQPPDPGFRLSRNIDLGHIISSVLILVSVCTGMFWLGGRFQGYDSALSETQKNIETITKNLDRVETAMRAMTSYDARLLVHDQRLSSDENQISDIKSSISTLITKIDVMIEKVSDVKASMPKMK